MTQKYEREIAEILERMERQGEPVPAARPRRERGQPRWARPMTMPGSSPRAGNLLWLGLVIGLPLAAALLNDILPWLAPWLMLAGLAVFLGPLAARLLGWARPAERRLWRGRVIDMPYHGDDGGARWRYQLWAWSRRLERWRKRR